MNPDRPTFNEYSQIRRMALRAPEEAFRQQQTIDEQWERLHYYGKPDFEESMEEHQSLRKILSGEEIEILMIPGSEKLFLDSIYVRDSMINTPRGLVLASMGKAERTGEPPVSADFLESQGFTILGRIEPPGKMEGGDLIWLDNTTCAVGLGYRTNEEGIRQFLDLLGPEFSVQVCVLPHQQGPKGVFHLMSILSPLDKDLVLAYSPLMAVPFRQKLVDSGIQIIDVPDDEYPRMGCNVLTLAPRKCLMLEGLLKTKSLLEENGCQVHTYKGNEISEKGEGGPTCLSLPLKRGE
ncbi:MAG: arginine deiminase family protein [SAR324 cluster bacterium]|jgi:N-dimethylarginine dimethylaminohydrolase|nr:arginine deiminase family protein [SAR324 cluster bacterium]MEE1576799.1 arginine deiminase family protein [Deltaproteobacteria bacterium]MDP7140403.1 arginine deiminase family protein [SAR324 cluster bacterium]MDP7335824.1 arginine deiminase family protein [SAR324 cluster bacterium]MDP7501739.1 arginine deiminase family protein [SAR324 cluster bacterium]